MASLTSDLPMSRATAAELYRYDGYAWAQQQAEALRRRDLGAIDWENVIEEIEAVGRAERRPWVSNCAQALEHMLAVEHCKTATPANLEDWETEIRAFRGAMAAAVRDSPSLQGLRAEMLALAWPTARTAAIGRLAAYSAAAAGAEDDWPHRRSWTAKLPEDCPYLVEHVAAYDHKRDKEPREDVWPPAVAVRLNTALGRDYRIRSAARRGPGWSR